MLAIESNITLFCRQQSFILFFSLSGSFSLWLELIYRLCAFFLDSKNGSCTICQLFVRFFFLLSLSLCLNKVKHHFASLIHSRWKSFATYWFARHKHPPLKLKNKILFPSRTRAFFCLPFSQINIFIRLNCFGETSAITHIKICNMVDQLCQYLSWASCKFGSHWQVIHKFCAIAYILQHEREGWKKKVYVCMCRIELSIFILVDLSFKGKKKSYVDWVLPMLLLLLLLHDNYIWPMYHNSPFDLFRFFFGRVRYRINVMATRVMPGPKS